MQKLRIYLSALLLVVTLFSSFGISKFIHYCGDEISSESFFLKDNDACGCDEEKEATEDCCTDEAQYAQSLQEFTHTPTEFPSPQIISHFRINNLSLFASANQTLSKSLDAEIFIEANHTPLFVLNRSILV